jgi:flagellar biosynthesis/type III secretory pathway M-ring protein FliF/YscJ
MTIPGTNDQPDDTDAVAAWLRGRITEALKSYVGPGDVALRITVPLDTEPEPNGGDAAPAVPR